MRLYCPECGRELPVEAVSLERGEAACADCGHITGLHALMAEPAVPSELEAPVGTNVVVQRPALGKVTLLVPSRSSCFFILFAAFWNVVMAVLTLGMVVAGPFDDGPPVMFITVSLLLFWAFGLGLVIVAVFSVYGKTLVHAEPGQLAIRKQLFGRSWTRRYPLEPDASADLVAAYEQNDQPVSACAVLTGAKEVKFGSFLSDDEKAWLVDLLNDVLGQGGPGADLEGPVSCPSCGQRLAGADLSLALGLAKCRRCNQLFGREELPSAPVPQPPETSAALTRNQHELRVALPSLASFGPGKTLLLLPIGIISAVLILHCTIGLPLLALALFTGVSAVMLAGFLRSAEMVFRQGAVEKETKLLGLRWRSVMPLARRPSVELVLQKRGLRIPRSIKPGRYAPLTLKHEAGTLEFGYFLSPAEKRWLRQEINEFLKHQATVAR